MVQQRGVAERDRLWSHPDLLPTSDDLDEPMDFVARQGMDDELAALTADDAAEPAEQPRDEDGDEDGSTTD
jgi:Zincin-like metallopeptidase